MKFKALLIALVFAPIVAYIVSSYVLWQIWSLALSGVVSIAQFSDLTTYSFLGIWGLGALIGFRIDRAKTGKKKKAKSPLDKDIGIKDVATAFRPSIRNAKLEIVAMGEGKNFHKTVDYKPSKDAQETEYKIGQKTYTVKNENLFIQKYGSLFPTVKLTAIFNKNGEPYKIKNSNNKVTAEILGLAKRSTALGESVKSMFHTDLPLKKIIFFVVVGIVAAVVVYVVTAGGFL